MTTLRTLRFNVNDLLIDKDPSCDFSGLVRGSKGYLRAEFNFSSEWDGCAKVAAFYNQVDKELGHAVLEDGKSCIIPEEALKRKIFKVRVFGTNGDIVLPTNTVEVNQNGGVS
jgi:hypothetical protein